MVVGININKNDEIKKKEFNEYFGSQSILLKVFYMLKLLEDYIDSRLVKEIVEKFFNLCIEKFCYDINDISMLNFILVQILVISKKLKLIFFVSIEEGKINVVVDSYLGNFKVDGGNIFDIIEIE